MTWRDVPMPERMQALPRTAGGLPVPRVALWTSERDDDPHLKRDPIAARYLGVHEPCYFAGGQEGDGKPILGEMDTGRQRKAIVELRCQVCYEPLGRKVGRRSYRVGPPARPPVWLADLRSNQTPDHPGTGEGAVRPGIGGQTILIGRRRVPLILEPWVCEPCLTYALQVCPGLLKRRAGDGAPLRLLHVRNWRCVGTRTYSKSRPELGTAIGYMKIAALDFEIILPDAYLTDRGIAPGQLAADPGRPPA